MFGPFALKGRPEASSEHTRKNTRCKTPKVVEQGADPVPKDPLNGSPGHHKKLRNFTLEHSGAGRVPREASGVPPQAKKTSKGHLGTSKTHRTQQRLCKKNAGAPPCSAGQVRRRICRQSRKTRNENNDWTKKRGRSVLCRGTSLTSNLQAE